jgi:prepilin-type N-terminal cleavage/methylation domain-containing protein
MGTQVLSERRGLTLIEVMVSLVILTGVLLGMASFAVQFMRATTGSDARTIAVNLTEQRISEIRASPNYSGLEANYNGTEATITGFTGYTRTTTIVHTGGPRPTYTNDYKTVTVSVTGPGLSRPVAKTIVVASP